MFGWRRLAWLYLDPGRHENKSGVSRDTAVCLQNSSNSDKYLNFPSSSFGGPAPPFLCDGCRGGPPPEGHEKMSLFLGQARNTSINPRLICMV